MTKKAKSIQALADEFLSTKNERTFGLIYDRLKPGIINHCNLILKDRDLAEDAFVNTVAKVWTKIDQYDKSRGNFSTWCYNIARNESLAILKEQNKYAKQDVEELEYTSAIHEERNPTYTIDEDPLWAFAQDPKDSIDTLYEKAIDEINALPELYKNIMIDREIHGMKYDEIADKYGVNRKSVATRIRRARNKIRENMEETK